MKQQSLDLRTWGGRRRGAGRKRARARPGVPHCAREDLRRYHPVHVTLCVADHVWNLRSARSFQVLDAALRGAQRRDGFRVVHFSVQGDHLHLIAEAEGTRRLASGMRALSIRLARGLNAMMGRRGRVLADRYHAHVLRTPAEVRNALRYVAGNFASHALRRGEAPPAGWVDPFSSAGARPPRTGQLSLWNVRATREPGTWLLRDASRERPAQSAGAGRPSAPPGSHGRCRPSGDRRSASLRLHLARLAGNVDASHHGDGPAA